MPPLPNQAKHLVQVEIIGPVHIKPQQPFIQYWIHISKLNLFCCQPPASAHFHILRRLRLRCISLVVVHIHHHFSRCTSAATGPHPSAQERPPFRSNLLFRKHTCRDFFCRLPAFLLPNPGPPASASVASSLQEAVLLHLLPLGLLPGSSIMPSYPRKIYSAKRTKKRVPFLAAATRAGLHRNFSRRKLTNALFRLAGEIKNAGLMVTKPTNQHLYFCI